jgi:serine/threonine-protein kinase
MEHIPGKDLKQLIREHGRYSIEDGIPLMVQACAGIGYAHRAGIVHCDVKPHNMLVASDGRLKVTDFGIARALATILPGEHTDVVWGSPLYFSPEQAKGEAPSPSSHVYSVGIVLYELLSGTPPFTASSADELARLHISARPIPIREYIPDIPRALEEIVMKVLSKEPSMRYRTADQLGRVLKTFGVQREAPVVKTQQTPPDRFPAREIPSVPRPDPARTHYRQSRQAPQSQPEPESVSSDVDLGFWVIAFVATAAVLGLIPFWMFVFYAWFPPS